MSRRFFFHIDLVDLYDNGRLCLTAAEQADALRYDDEWSALYLDGEARGRIRIARVTRQRVDMIAELADPGEGLPPYLQISRVRITAGADHVDKFMVMVRPQIDRSEKVLGPT